MHHRISKLLGIAALGCAICITTGCGGAQARKAKHLEKGDSYLAAGNFQKARVEFQNALQIAPMDAEARFKNGLVDDKLMKVREAAQFYQGTLDVNPDHLHAATNLARLLILNGAIDRALPLLEHALQKNPDDSELLALRAAARVHQNDMEGGLLDAERAVQLDRRNEDAVGTLAGIHVAQKHFDQAQQLLEEACKALPESVDLRLALAQFYLSQNRLAEAEVVLTDLVRLRPQERAQRIRLAQFYEKQNQDEAAERVLREGIKAIPQDKDLKLALIEFLAARRGTGTAEKELRGMIAASPKDVDLQFALARFYEGNREPQKAEKIYRELIDSQKLNAAGLTARDRLALLLAQRNDVAGTEALIREVLAKSPRDTDALVLRGNIELANKDPKSAIADLRTVLRDQPNAIGVMRSLARAHVANGEPAIAEETMRRAVEANPKDPSARLDLTQLLAQLGEPEQALPVLKELVKDQPNNGAALDALFKVSAGLKDYVTAKSAADAIVATQPKLAAGYLYEGLLAEETKHDDDALHLYGQATDLQPDALEPLQTQIRLLVRLKRIPEALKRVDQVSERSPTSAIAPAMKGELLLAQHDAEGAASAYQVAITRAPTWWLPYRGLANAQFEAKKPEAAIATLHDGEPRVADPDPLTLEIAAYDETSGKPQDAIREYEEVIRRNPQSEVAANNLAMLLVTFKADAQSLDRAKSLSARFANSANLSYLDTYGWVLFKHGEAAASVPVFERVVAKAPDAPVVLYHLGMAQSQSGSTAQAVDNLSKAIQSGTQFAGLEEAKAMLSKLGKT